MCVCIHTYGSIQEDKLTNMWIQTVTIPRSHEEFESRTFSTFIASIHLLIFLTVVNLGSQDAQKKTDL